MFEFIGVVVTVIIVFKLIKGVFKGATKGTLLRACELAQSKGVPHEFALKAIRNPDELINIRKSLAQENREFGGWMFMNNMVPQSLWHIDGGGRNCP